MNKQQLDYTYTLDQIKAALNYAFFEIHIDEDSEAFAIFSPIANKAMHWLVATNPSHYIAFNIAGDAPQAALDAFIVYLSSLPAVVHYNHKTRLVYVKFFMPMSDNDIGLIVHTASFFAPFAKRATIYFEEYEKIERVREAFDDCGLPACWDKSCNHCPLCGNDMRSSNCNCNWCYNCDRYVKRTAFYDCDKGDKRPAPF